jgi:hypothetical protein
VEQALLHLRFDLNELGRLHVAKQVLVSSFDYHASFLMPSDALLAKIVKSICGQGLPGGGPHPAPDAHAQQGSGVPALLGHGGVQRADIPAQVQALQAKVAAMLLHPRRHAWKVLVQRAFQRYVPALGPVFVSNYAPVNKASRSSRHVAIGGLSHG